MMYGNDLENALGNISESVKVDAHLFESFSQGVKSGLPLSESRVLYGEQRDSLSDVGNSCDKVVAIIVQDLLQARKEFLGRKHHSSDTLDPVANNLALVRHKLHRQHYEYTGEVLRPVRSKFEAYKRNIQCIVDTMDKYYCENASLFDGVRAFSETIYAITPIRFSYVSLKQ
ncbi:MAG: hypothetical protein ACE5FT_07015 [Candidatus Nanoarchaeia archaeon]